MRGLRPHRVIAEVVPLHRLDKEGGLHAVAPEAASKKASPCGWPSTSHGPSAGRPGAGRIGERPGDAELRVDGEADAHDCHPATAI
jgi:hypothetical protein